MSTFRPSAFSRALLGRMLRLRALREHGDRAARVSPIFARWQDNLHPAIVDEATRLVDAAAFRLHDHAHALSSSQAFAMNLFLPLRVGNTAALARFLSDELGRSVTVEGVEQEYYGSGDLLAEIPGSTPTVEDKLTCADVAVHLQDDTGARGLLLVEVKLAEEGFTPCGGAVSAGNRDHGPCEDRTVLWAEPHRCYLRRPYRAQRDRRYWSLFAAEHGTLERAFPGADAEGACPFVGDWQQPMRNHALALAATRAGLADFWALALVHHDDNPDVAGPWDAYAAACASSARIRRWPASRLLPAIDAALPDTVPSPGRWLAERYFLGVPP
jgi:hypothetical protein